MDYLRGLLLKVGGAGRMEGRNLSVGEAEEGFTALLEGQGTSAQVAGFLVAMRAKGADADEVIGFAHAARERATMPTLPEGGVAVSGTRGGKRLSPPMALASALAASACGVPVLLSGFPSGDRSGVTVADIWRHLVGPLCETPQQVETCLREGGVACWLPTASDPGWERLFAIEDELGIRSVADTVSKLLAPAASPLLVSAAHGPVLGIAGEVLLELGHVPGLVVQGSEGSVDPVVTRRTRGLQLGHDGTFPLRVQPEDLGLFAEAEPELERGADSAAAAAATRCALLCEQSASTISAVIGGALLLQLAGKMRDLPEAVGQIQDALRSGAAQAKLDTLKDLV